VFFIVFCLKADKNAYRILVGKPEGKRQLGRHRYGWEVNIMLNLREIILDAVAWIHLAQSRDKWRSVVNTVMSLRAPLMFGRFLSN
jgi:hypothetical protein